MRAMVLEEVGQPLVLRDVPKPKAGRGQLLVRVSACAVCRTDLHIVDGELPNPKLPLILGHQIVGRIEEINISSDKGQSGSDFKVGDRVGIPWLGWTDGDCTYCRSNRENLAIMENSPATISTAATTRSLSPMRVIVFDC